MKETKQPEAVVLAWSNLEGTKFVGNSEKWKHPDCVLPLCDATKLRRLHALNQELLEALCCVRDMVGHPDNLNFIDAAISKAQGASNE